MLSARRCRSIGNEYLQTWFSKRFLTRTNSRQPKLDALNPFGIGRFYSKEIAEIFSTPTIEKRSLLSKMMAVPFPGESSRKSMCLTWIFFPLSISTVNGLNGRACKTSSILTAFMSSVCPLPLRFQSCPSRSIPLVQSALTWRDSIIEL